MGNHNIPQSDDVYETIRFRRRDDGSEVRGTVGWREGAENRVIFNVWNAVSHAAEGRDLQEAFSQAIAGIKAQGFAPLGASAGALELNDLVSPQGEATGPGRDAAPGDGLAAPQARRLAPFFWLLAALVLLAIVWPALLAAEIPRPDRTAAFANAPYLWRYEGPDFDPASDQAGSAVRLRSEGAPSANALTPRIVILDGETEEQVASYTLEGGSFCDFEDDNCARDGLFPVILASAPGEPVLAVVAHVGVHGQRLVVFRPLIDAAAPVFEVTADYALDFKVMPDGLFVELEHADASGAISREVRMWFAGDAKGCDHPAAVSLPPPPGPSESAAGFEYELHRIARARDLDAFTDLLAEDVTISFGGNGGKAEFHDHFDLDTAEGERQFWAILDGLLAEGGWKDRGEGELMTWPWFFAAWPSSVDAGDAYISGPDTILRAGPDEDAPVLASLPAGVLHFADPAGDADEPLDWSMIGWLPVATPEHCLGYVRADQVTPLLGTRMVAFEDGGVWRIEALVAGD